MSLFHSSEAITCIELPIELEVQKHRSNQIAGPNRNFEEITSLSYVFYHGEDIILALK